MNVIDKLVVTLGLDPSGYKKGVQETERDQKKLRDSTLKTSKEMEAKGKQAAEFFSRIKKEVLALTTVMLGGYGLKSFIENVTTGDAALGRMAKNVGMSVGALSAWEGAVQRAGGSAQGMAGSIRAINDHLQTMNLTGNDSAVGWLVAANADTRKFYSNTTSMNERLLSLADAFHKLSPQMAQKIGGNMGIDTGTIQLLMKGRKAVEDMLEAQRKRNVANKHDAQLAIERQNAWKNLKDEFYSVGRVLLNRITPAIVRIVKETDKWLEKNKEWIDTGIISHIKSMATYVENVAGEFDHWKIVIEAIFGLWIGAKFARVIANVARLGGAIASAAGSGASLLGKLGAAALSPLGAGAIGGAAALAYPTSMGNGELTPFSTMTPFAMQSLKKLINSRANLPLVATMPSSHSTTETHIGHITIQVPSGDPDTIAKGIKDSLRRHGLATQANTGMR